MKAPKEGSRCRLDKDYYLGVRRNLLPLTVIAAAVLLAGCSGVTAESSSATNATSENSDPFSDPEPVTVLAVGDSLASGGPWDAVPGDPGSWTYFLDEEPTVEIVGGWRRDGATSKTIAENIPDESARVLAIMAGTNDVRKSEPLDQLAGHLMTAVDRVEVDAVIISAIPPEPAFADRVRIANSIMKELAQQRGWIWIDAWSSVRDGDSWTDGATADGVHASLPAYRQAAETFIAAMSMLGQA